MTVRRPEAARVVSTLRLTISLRVVGRRSCNFDPKDAIQFAHEVSDELRSVIRYDSAREPVELPDMIQEESSSSFGQDDGVGSHKVCLLGPKVDNVHDRVVAMGTWEFADKVDAHNVPRRIRNGHRVQFTVRFVSRRLHATAQIASLCVQTNLPAQTGPPVAS